MNLNIVVMMMSIEIEDDEEVFLVSDHRIYSGDYECQQDETKVAPVEDFVVELLAVELVVLQVVLVVVNIVAQYDEHSLVVVVVSIVDVARVSIDCNNVVANLEDE